MNLVGRLMIPRAYNIFVIIQPSQETDEIRTERLLTGRLQKFSGMMNKYIIF